MFYVILYTDIYWKMLTDNGLTLMWMRTGLLHGKNTGIGHMDSWQVYTTLQTACSYFMGFYAGGMCCLHTEHLMFTPVA